MLGAVYVVMYHLVTPSAKYQKLPMTVHEVEKWQQEVEEEELDDDSAREHSEDEHAHQPARSMTQPRAAGVQMALKMQKQG